MELLEDERRFLTKQEVRTSVWDLLEEKDLANYPRPVHDRIPNFQGSAVAANLLAQLEEFREAEVIKVNPDKPQEEVRFLALVQQKEVLVPTPRLKSGLLNRLVRQSSDGMKELRVLATRRGIDQQSEQLELERKLTIDLVVVGSVAVDKLGHRIGKGEGYADLEFAMMAQQHGAVGPDATVVTTVHDCQVFDSLPADLFSVHDVPVDIIVTPTTVHRVTERLGKNVDIVWDILTEEKLRQIPLLGFLKKQTQDGDCKEVVGVKQKKKRKKKVRSMTNTHGFMFSGIPQETRISDFKEAVRSTGAVLTFVTWKGKRGAAKAFFEGEKEDLWRCLEDLRVGDQRITVTELEENVDQDTSEEQIEKGDVVEKVIEVNNPDIDVSGDDIAEETNSDQILQEVNSPEIDVPGDDIAEKPDTPEMSNLSNSDQNPQVGGVESEETEKDEPIETDLKEEVKTDEKEAAELKPSVPASVSMSIPSYCDLIRDVQISTDRRTFSNDLQSDYLPSSHLTSVKRVSAPKQKKTTQTTQEKLESRKTDAIPESQDKTDGGSSDKPDLKAVSSLEEAATKKIVTSEKQASVRRSASEKSKASEKVERSSSRRSKKETRDQSHKTGSSQETKAPESQLKPRKSASSKSKSGLEDTKSEKSRESKRRTPSLPRTESSKDKEKDNCVLS